MELKNGKAKNVLLIAMITAAAFVIGSVFCFRGFFAVTFQGLSYINQNRNEYFRNKTELDDEIEFTLTSAESNQTLNKCIYDANDCKIFITGFRTGKEACVFFRTGGKYSVNGARLVTCVNNDYVSENSETASLYSTLVCLYNENEYECSPQGYTWCNDKDGNMFGYYLPEEINRQTENGNFEIKFRLKGLLKYTWNKR